MDNEKKQKTFVELTETNIRTEPKVLQQALDSYLEESTEILSEKEHQELKNKINNDPKYNIHFQKSLCYTSLIILYAVKEAMGPAVNEDGKEEFSYQTYVEEFLALSRKDDEHIYRAKMYYLANMTAEEVNLSIDGFDIPPDPTSAAYISLKESIENAAKKYESLRGKLIKEYEKKNSFLVA